MKAKQQVSGLTKSHVRPEDQEAELVRLHQSTVRDALAIGKLLIEMRNQQPRGEWTAYLESVGVRTGISRASLFRYISAIEKPKKEKNPGPGDFRKAVSPDGHQCMGLLQSWLQKAIRRNDFEEAKYAMEQFYATGFPGAVWTIVRRSASEDIGVAERGVVEEIRALKWAFDQEKHEDGSDDDPRLLHLVHAVLVVCRAKKSRLVDHALI
jgi:hypothetical protein